MIKEMQRLYCKRCNKELGYIFYQSWIDYEFCLCKDCIKTDGEKDEKNRE